jgi:hypothetical protein
MNVDDEISKSFETIVHIKTQIEGPIKNRGTIEESNK